MGLWNRYYSARKASNLESVPVIVLAGGKGTRLIEVTNGKLPKPLVLVRGEPVIKIVIDQLLNAGIKQIVVTVHHQAEQIIEFLETIRVEQEISYIEEDKLLGTAGSISNTFEAKPTWSHALVVNSDTLLSINPTPLLSMREKKRGTVIEVVLQRKPTSSQVYRIQNENVIAVQTGGDHGGFIHTGVTLVDREDIPALEQVEGKNLETFIFPKLIEEGRLFAVKENKQFIDIGTPKDFLIANGGT